MTEFNGLDVKTVWKNDKARRKWLKNYADWGLWLETPGLGLKWYKYELGDGEGAKVIIVCEYNVSYEKNRRAAVYYLKSLAQITEPSGAVFNPQFSEGISQAAEKLKRLKEAAAKIK